MGGTKVSRSPRILRDLLDWDEEDLADACVIDLFAGSGHAILRDSHRRVLASPLIALSIPDPFTHYVFCENDLTKFRALQERVRTRWPNASVTCIEGDANARAKEIAGHIPAHSTAKRVLSFCFIDPYDLKLDF